MKIIVAICAIFLIGFNVNSQSIDVIGKLKITNMDTVNTADSLVVRLADGTLALREVATLTEFQILSISNDTIFLTNGGFVKIPPEMDGDTTNEIQAFSVSLTDDTLYLSNSNWIIIPGISVANAPPPIFCDQGLAINSVDPLEAAQAIGICDSLQNAEWVLPDGSPPPVNTNFSLGYGLLSMFGTSVTPQDGERMLALSTGTARTPSDIGYGADLDKGYSNNHPIGFPVSGAGCPTPSINAFDGVALKLTLSVPINATSFSFDYKFYTKDYPTAVCTEFVDQAAVIMDPVPPTYSSPGNILFDQNNNVVGVNSTIITVCSPSGSFTCPDGTNELSGTGFEGNGGSSWITQIIQCQPNTTIEITIAIWDSGDASFTSTLLIDNWKWLVDN